MRRVTRRAGLQSFISQPSDRSRLQTRALRERRRARRRRETRVMRQSALYGAHRRLAFSAGLSQSALRAFCPTLQSTFESVYILLVHAAFARVASSSGWQRSSRRPSLSIHRCAHERFYATIKSLVLKLRLPLLHLRAVCSSMMGIWKLIASLMTLNSRT